jgi:NADPH:quinone reductase
MREGDPLNPMMSMSTTTPMTSAIRRVGGSSSVVPRPGAGQLRLRPTARGRGFVVGEVEANGPDTVGFANRDRVAWRDTSTELPDLLLIDQDDVLGVPDWITDDQVVRFLGPGLVARALLRSSRPVGRGDAVRVISTDPVVSALAAAWARSLGARIVDDGPALVLQHAPGRRRPGSSHGKLAQAAVDVFQAIRSGVFDDVPADGTPATAA